MSGLDAWMSSGEYLPPFMRDFHDQKDLFKALEEVAQRSRDNHPGDNLLNISWRDAHVYTVDIFLWVMAKRGYTLQRSRKRGVTFGDIYEFVADYARRSRDQMASVLRSAFK